jgi:hypothetical protein
MRVDDINASTRTTTTREVPEPRAGTGTSATGATTRARPSTPSSNRTIPPEVYIVEPDWFEVIDPDRTPNGRHRDLPPQQARDGEPARYDSVDWVLEYATGVAPPMKAFVQIATGKTDGLEGKCATWDVSAPSRWTCRQEASTDPHQNAVTLRLRATRPTGRRPWSAASTARATSSHTDPTSWAAFPIHLKTPRSRARRSSRTSTATTPRSSSSSPGRRVRARLQARTAPRPRASRSAST